MHCCKTYIIRKWIKRRRIDVYKQISDDNLLGET